MKHALLFCTVFISQFLWSQDLGYVRYVLDSLCSERMAGRGYVANGLDNAAVFIARQMDSLGLEKVDGERFQEFSYAVNTFPEASSVEVDGVALRAGVDFLVNAKSPAYNGTIPLQHVDSVLIEHPEKLRMLPGVGFIVHPVSPNNIDLTAKRAGLIQDIARRGPVIVPVSKLTWSVGTEQYKYPIIEVLDSVIDWPGSKRAYLDVKAEFNASFSARNIVGMLPAKKHTHRYIVFTAHYDHLGRMGDALFPGGNDNASGTAAMLDLARYYADHPSEYNILFIAFAGEEAGLVGSKHFVEQPLLPLEKIEFLINLDLIGNGEDGITVVNGKLFEEDFKKLASINKEKGYLEKVRIRGAAANSDHYWFSESGVPAFFIYTHGDRTAYHDVNDIPSTLQFTGYEGLFHLITEFIENR